MTQVYEVDAPLFTTAGCSVETGPGAGTCRQAAHTPLPAAVTLAGGRQPAQKYSCTLLPTPTVTLKAIVRTAAQVVLATPTSSALAVAQPACRPARSTPLATAPRLT